MNLFDVTKSRALKVINIILVIMMLGFAIELLSQLVYLIGEDFYIEQIKDIIISIGTLGILSLTTWLLNKK